MSAPNPPFSAIRHFCGYATSWIDADELSRSALASALLFVFFEQQHASRTARRRVRFLKNRTEANIVKRDCEFMLFGEVLYLLLALAQAHVPRPDPRELRIINGANLLFLQFSFNQVGKLTHEGIASFCVHLFHLKGNPVHI